MPFGHFVGIGVSNYADTATGRRLDHAVADVQALQGLLDGALTCTTLPDPGEAEVRELLKNLRESLPGVPLVVVWSGHGRPSAVDGLRLLARDSGPGAAAGIGAGELAGWCAESGANQLLFVVDTCYAGAAVPAGEVAAKIFQGAPPRGEHVWVGVLASCLDVETARDGLFGERLRDLIERGPRTPVLRVRWSAHSQYVRGDDVCDAVLKEWDSDVQRPDFSSRGSAWWVFPNPLYDPGAPDQVVEHLLLAARGGARLDERSWFTGRAVEVSAVAGWVRSGGPGLRVVTGPAGTGKTAIVGRVVSLANPAERARLVSEGLTWEHDDPGEGSVHAHLHARALTADRAAAVLAGQLVSNWVLPPQQEPRNAAELTGQVQRAVEGGATPPVLVVDGLDEARSEAFAIADKLLLALAPYAVVIVATREMRSGDEDRSLVEILAPGGAGLDLGDPGARERTRADLAAYVTARLAGVDRRMDPRAIADHLAGDAASEDVTSGDVASTPQPFLLARLVTDQLRADPVDTTRPGWQTWVSASIELALDADLAAVEPPAHRPGLKAAASAALARTLLAALTWGYGAGVPEAEWLCIAAVLALGADPPDRDDVLRVLGQLGRYIVQDGEGGTAVYRIAHQSLADHLRPPFRASHEQPFDPQALPVARVLADRYRALLAGGVPAEAPGYLWRYFWRHAAAAGSDGLAVLRDLARDTVALGPDVALAAMAVAAGLRHWGRRVEAVAPVEEAAGIYQYLAEQNPALTPDLAGVLNNLGIRYSEVGRRAEAVAPVEEAVGIFRDLAGQNPAFAPDLANVLNNLGNRYSEVGRRVEAVAPAEEAAGIYQDLAEQNPAFTPYLASALNNLGNRYSEVGRRAEAVAPAEEAAGIYQDLAEQNPAFTPDLASALNNLGIRFSQVGRRAEAVSPAEEAVRLRRDLAEQNPAFAPDLAMTLNNLGIHYIEVGRRAEAVAPTEEAAAIYRDLAQQNPAFRPDLAMALNNLGNRYSEVGRRAEAVAPTEEAAAIYRDLAEQNPAFTPDLAMALNNLGACYSEVGRRAEAVAPTEEAVRLRRDLAEQNPAFTPDLASALNNLGIHYGEVGRRAEAIAPTEEAAAIYRDLAEQNPAFTPDLARALNNLGTRYSEVGRRAEAIAPTEEAVRLRRDLAEQNPAFTPDLASALNNLGNRYSEMGRSAEAVTPTEEAVRLRRDLAEQNPAFTPDLAGALNNLGNRYSEMGRSAEAVTPTEEAAGIYRDLAEQNPAFTSDLAMALNNLGNRYSEVGRQTEAVAPTEEAARIYRDLAKQNPAFTPNLAMALNNLGDRYGEVGALERADAAWDDAIASFTGSAAAYLLTARISAAEPGDPRAARWLSSALGQAGDGDRPLLAEIHDQARRHWNADQGRFAAAWDARADEPALSWLTVDKELLASARAWTATATYADERDYLAGHPELLDPSADVAVSEALLPQDEDEARRYEDLRQAAGSAGVEAAYQPLLLAILASQFAEGDASTQRSLLESRREDILSDTVRGVLADMAEDGDLAAHRALALLDLAAIGEHELVLDGISDPSSLPALLHGYAVRPDTTALAPAAMIAAATATEPAEVALAWMYAAMAAAIAGDAERATGLLDEARRIDPEHALDWIGLLADVGQQHSEVLPLISALTRAPREAPAEDDDEPAS